MKTIKIPHLWKSTPVLTAKVEYGDSHPVRTALERNALAGRDPGELRQLRSDAVDERDDLDDDDGDRTHLDRLISNIDREISAPSDNARLDGASLVGASLVGARLDGASLDGASLDGARLDGARDDFYAVLNAAPNEVSGLLEAIRDGRINGSQYEGECACLVGTIAKVRGCNYESLGDLRPDSGRPSEVWFMALKPGHTPANHQVAAITERWIVEWMAARQPLAATPVTPIVNTEARQLRAGILAIIADDDMTSGAVRRTLQELLDRTTSQETDSE